MTRLTARRGLLALALVLPACRKDPTPVQPPVPVTTVTMPRISIPQPQPLIWASMLVHTFTA